MSKWKQIYNKKANFVCPYCLKIVPLIKATIEHEPPKSRQKELGESQTYLCCKPCNEEKGALTVEEYKVWKHLNLIRNGVIKGNER